MASTSTTPSYPTYTLSNPQISAHPIVAYTPDVLVINASDNGLVPVRRPQGLEYEPDGARGGGIAPVRPFCAPFLVSAQILEAGGWRRREL